MKIAHQRNGISFEWDSEKAALNRQKHDVDFETACEVFFDPFVQPTDAGEWSDEARLAVIGMTEGWDFLFVVYVERGDALRIISARPATTKERRHYEDV